MRTTLPSLALATCLLSGVVLAPGTASAAPLFPNPVYLVGSNPYGMGMADFNRDGFPDLVVGNYGIFADTPGDLSVLMGRGDGTFDNEVRIPTSEKPTEALAADLNGDGNGDLIIGYSQSSAMDVVVKLGDGHGSFGTETVVATDVYAFRLADFDGDGRVDLLAEMSALEPGFRAYLGLGDGSFLAMPVVNPGQSTQPVNADINGDGRDDVLTLSYDATGYAYEILVYLGNGDGSFTAAGSVTTTDPVFNVVAADLDGDGRDDMAVEFYHLHDSGSNEDVGLYFSDGSTFLAGPLTEEQDLVSLVAGDRNGDGIRDFTIIGSFAVCPYLGLGSRAYQALPFFYSGSYLARGLAADFDRDGHGDLAIVANASEAVFIYAGNADGTYGPPVDTTLRDSYLGGVVTDDFNGDGALDIAIAVVDHDQIAIKLGHGDGTFGAETRVAAGFGPFFVASTDVNQDGRKDLVVTTRNWHFDSPIPIPPGDLLVLIGNGDGTFQPPVSYGEPGLVNPNAMHVQDIDDDGLPDVLVADGTDYSFPGATPVLSYFHGNGDGTFSFVGHLSVGAVNPYPNVWTFPMGISSGDYDGDGHGDIAVAVSGLAINVDPPVPGTVVLLRGLGAGTFADPVVVGSGIDLRDVTTADLDGDGAPDLAAADIGSYPWPPGPGGLYTLRNDGAGGFLQSPLRTAGHAPMAIQVFDMNDDGAGDLVATDGYGYVSIHEAQGGGAYGPPLYYGLFGDPLALVAGDFNGDGLRDILVVSSSGTFVLRNQTPPPTPLQIVAHVSYSSPAGKGSGTVTWTTNAENDLIGFNVIQITSTGRQQINQALIPCQECSSGQGASYATIVPKHKSGKSFYIEAVHADHTVETFGPAIKQ